MGAPLDGTPVGAPATGKARHSKVEAGSPSGIWTSRSSCRNYTLVWFFWPSLLAGLGVWWGVNNWLPMPDWTAWLFVAGAAVLYVVIGLRGRQLLLFGSRLIGR